MPYALVYKAELETGSALVNFNVPQLDPLKPCYSVSMVQGQNLKAQRALLRVVQVDYPAAVLIENNPAAIYIRTNAPVAATAAEAGASEPAAETA